MVLIIKNMVCERCKKAVKDRLGSLGFRVVKLDLGEVEIAETLSPIELAIIRSNLEKDGFELLHDPRRQAVEKVKNAIIQHIHHKKEKPESQNFSDFLSENTKFKYSSLSKIFSEFEGRTIEHFIIIQKTERVKELLIYNEKTLSEIAWKLQYSSVQHLSAQFKKTTGMTPSQFKKSTKKERKELDKL